LLFISAFGEGDERQISFAHFSEDPHLDHLATLRVLGWDGDGHTAYGEGSACVDTIVNDYLIDLAVPRSGTVCQH
jgi:hypothetical protein